MRKPGGYPAAARSGPLPRSTLIGFNPLEHQGIPLDRQLRSWRELDVEPIDPDHADPYTRCRIITMNGIEVEAILFSHQFARRCPDPEVKRQLAEVRYIEHQQQKTVNWLLPGLASVLETTIAYEQVAVDLTGWIARHEPDPYLKQAYEFGVLEDFDHLYRYANLYEMIEHRKAESIVHNLTEVMPGRPTKFHHRHPHDNVREPYDRSTTNPLSKLHALTIMSAEQQTMNFYTRVLPVPVLHGAGAGPEGAGDLGAAPEHGARTPADRLRPDAPPRRP